jgi:hypothetical protein
MNKTLSSDRSLLGGCLGLILSIPIEFTWTFSFSARALAIECSARAFHLGSGIRILDACRRFGGSSFSSETLLNFRARVCVITTTTE